MTERLSWELTSTNGQQREQNKIALWAVNADLNVFDPAVEDDEGIVGGRHSRENEWYPFQDQVEAQMAMMVVEKANVLSEASWAVWHEVASYKQSQRKSLAELHPNSTQSPRRAPRKGNGMSPVSSLPTPPSSDPPHKDVTRRSYENLSDFYSILDNNERPSPMGARYLEAYAERLHVDVCKDCWFKNTIIDLPDEDEEASSGEGTQVGGESTSERAHPEHAQVQPLIGQSSNGDAFPPSPPYRAASTQRYVYTESLNPSAHLHTGNPGGSCPMARHAASPYTKLVATPPAVQSVVMGA